MYYLFQYLFYVMIQILFILLLGFPDSFFGKESTCNAGEPSSIPESGRSTGEGIGYPLQDFPGGSAGKESACHVGDLGSIPGLGRSPGERNIYPLYYFGLENSTFTSLLYCCCPVAQSCLTLGNPIDCSTPGSFVLHCLPEFAQVPLNQ